MLLWTILLFLIVLFAGLGMATVALPALLQCYLLIRNLNFLLDTAMLLQLQQDLVVVACRHEL